MNEEDKRRRIMQAAEKLFATGRFHEITTDDVAREACVGKGTIYRHFRDKDDLFFETANSGFDELCDLLREKVSRKSPFPEQILQACVEITQFFKRRRQLFEMMQSTDGRMSFQSGPLLERWLRKRKRLVDAVAEILVRGVKEGAIRSDVPPNVLANFFLGMLRTRTRDLEEYPESLRRFELVLDVFTRGAGLPRHGPGHETAGAKTKQRKRTGVQGRV